MVLSFTQSLVIIGAGFVLFGRKDAPVIARRVGYGLGRLVGMLQTGREQAEILLRQQQAFSSKDGEQFTRSLGELQKLRHEVRNASVMASPTSILSNAMNGAAEAPHAAKQQQHLPPPKQ